MGLDFRVEDPTAATFELHYELTQEFADERDTTTTGVLPLDRYDATSIFEDEPNWPISRVLADAGILKDDERSFDKLEGLKRASVEIIWPEVPEEVLNDVKSGNAYPKARWGYGGFMRFRQRLFQDGLGGENLRNMSAFQPMEIEIAEMRGIPHYNHHGPQGYEAWKKEQLDWWRENRCYSWEPYFSHENGPLVWLIHHSDCDGDLSAEQCKLIAPVLRKVVSAWDKDDYDRTSAESLASMMDVCAKHGLRLIFC